MKTERFLRCATLIALATATGGGFYLAGVFPDALAQSTMGKPVMHFEVVGKDGKKLHSFYSQLFDWKIDANNPTGYGEVTTGAGAGINGGIGQTRDGSAGHVTFYIAVADLEATLDKVAQLGGRTILPPTPVMPTVTIALFADPEGHVIGLVKR